MIDFSFDEGDFPGCFGEANRNQTSAKPGITVGFKNYVGEESGRAMITTSSIPDRGNTGQVYFTKDSAGIVADELSKLDLPDDFKARPSGIPNLDNAEQQTIVLGKIIEALEAMSKK